MLVTVEDLTDTLEWTPDADELRLVSATLEDLSDLAVFHGSAAWTTPQNTPLGVKRLILKAARRFLRNPDGYTTSKAGDETVGWSDRDPNLGNAQFTPDEVKMLKTWGRKPTIVSVEVYHSSQKASEDICLQVIGGKPFPYYAADPW